VARPAFLVETGRWWPLMRAAAAIGTASVFAVVLFRADMTMLAAFEPAAVVGHYGAAYRLLEATLFVSWSVGSAVYPVFSRLSPTSEPAVGFVFERSLKLVVALTLPVAAGAFVLAGPVVRLVYGDEYAEAIDALRLLAPAIALYPVAYVAASLLVSQNRQRAMMITYGIVAAENILANLVLIPWLSLDGAALGTSISQLFVTVALIAFAQRAAGGLDWSRVAAGPVAATLAASGGMVVFRDELAIAVMAGAALYVAVIFLFERFLFPDDARAVLDLLPWRTA
jgi:O-antigen/teichoic acid export membrane protein